MKGSRASYAYGRSSSLYAFAKAGAARVAPARSVFEMTSRRVLAATSACNEKERHQNDEIEQNITDECIS